MSKCNLCGDRDEMVNRIITECSKLTWKEYKNRLDNIEKKVHLLIDVIVDFKVKIIYDKKVEELKRQSKVNTVETVPKSVGTDLEELVNLK